MKVPCQYPGQLHSFRFHCLGTVDLHLTPVMGHLKLQEACFFFLTFVRVFFFFLFLEVLAKSNSILWMLTQCPPKSLQLPVPSLTGWDSAQSPLLPAAYCQMAGSSLCDVLTPSQHGMRVSS